MTSKAKALAEKAIELRETDSTSKLADMLILAIEALEEYAGQSGFYDRPETAQEALSELESMAGET